MRYPIHHMASALVTMIAVLGVSSYAQGQGCGEWTRLAPSGGPTPRHDSPMVYDSNRNVVVLFGGSGPGGYLGDTWEWDGSEWTLVAQTGPTPRWGHVMAYDSVRGVTVLFGGFDGASRGDTWVWDGVEWTDLTGTTDQPSRRADAAMTFDSHRQVMVLFGGGGINGNTYAEDTWEWDGSGWSLRALAGPAGRRGHAMAFDPDRRRVVLFGSSDDLSDTWEWDGEDWRLISRSGPPARQRHQIIYEPQARLCLIFHGFIDRSNQRLRDVWAWNGAEWTPFHSEGPSARTFGGLTYHDQLERVVAFGGYDGSGDLNDLWSWRYDYFIRSHPKDRTLREGVVADFFIDAPSRSGVQYQWYRDGQPLVDAGNVTGSQTSHLSLARLFRSDEGVLECEVSSSCSTTRSHPAFLNVISPVLHLTSDCRGGGYARFSWQDASPGGQVGLYYASELGRTRLPAGPCAGTNLDLGRIGLILLLQMPAGTSGSGRLWRLFHPEACGGYLQLLDSSSCAVSNTVTLE